MISRTAPSRHPIRPLLTDRVCPALPSGRVIFDDQPDKSRHAGLLAEVPRSRSRSSPKSTFGTLRATQPARPPTSVAPRGRPLSLPRAHLAQDGRSVPRSWTLQRRLQWCRSFRRAAGPHGRCVWPQTLTPRAIRAFSLPCARPSAGFVGVEVAGRTEGRSSVGW